MNPRTAAASLVALVAFAAACSSSTSPGDDRTPVTVSLGPPSTVPLLAASTNRIYTLRGIDPTSIAVEARSLNGAQRWRVTFPSCQDACFLAADGQDNIYLTTATSTVSLTGASGAVRWTAPIRGAVVAVGSNGRVYVASRPFAVPQRVYSLEAATGDINWITTVLPSLDATGLLVDEFHSTIYAVGRGRVSVLNILNGAVQRTTAADCFGGSQGAVAADGSVYVSCDSDLSSRLIAYQPGGIVKWVTPLGTINGTSAPVIDATGTIYVANRGALSALRPDGALLWQLNGLFNNDVTPAVGSNNDVYIHAARTDGGSASLLVVNNGAVVEDKGPMGCALAFLLTPTGRVYCGSNGGFAFFQGNNSDAMGQWNQLGRDSQRGSRKQ